MDSVPRENDDEEDGFDDPTDVRAARLIADMTSVVEGVSAVLVPFRSIGDTVIGVELTDLNADVPGSGAGTRFMSALIAAADAGDLNLHVSPGSPRNREFYERFGFEVRQGRGGPSMLRVQPLPSHMQWLEKGG